MQHKQVLKAGCYSRNPEVAPADICQIIAKGAWTSCGSELIAVWSDIHHWCHRYMYIMILSCTFWITVDTFYTLPRTALSAFTPIHETWLPSGYLQRRQFSEANRWIKKVRISLRLVACLTGQATPDGHLTVTWRSPDGHLTVTWRSPDVLLDQFCQHPPFITVETICTSDCQAITFAPESRTLREALFSHVMAVLQTWRQHWDELHSCHVFDSVHFLIVLLYLSIRVSWVDVCFQTLLQSHELCKSC